MVLNDIIDQVSERPMSKATHLSSAFQAFSSSPNHHQFHHSHRQPIHGPHYHRLDICRDPGTGSPVKFFLTV